MNVFNNNIINFNLEEIDDGLYNVTMYYNKIKYKGVYSPIIGFIYSSLYDEEALGEILNEIKKTLIKEQ